VETAAAMKKALKDKQWDIILCDYKMPNFSGPSAIAVLKESNIDIPLIVVTGTVGEETAADCMRLGAKDYIMKGNLSRLCPAIARELEDAKVRNKQKQAEESLREIEERFAAAFHASPNMIAITRMADGKILDINEGYSKLLGYSRGESIGKTTEELSIWADPADCATFVGRLEKFGEINGFETILRRNDGTLVTVFDSARIIELQGEKYFLSVVQDITEHKRADEDLYLSEERFRLLSEAAFEAIAIHEEGVLLNANDQYFKMFGYEPDEALGKEMISITFAPESLEFVKKRLATDSLELCEAIGVRKDGTRFPMEIRTRKMEYKGRTVRFGAIRDITDRKRTEDELRESEEKYRELVRYAPAGIYEFDYETNRFISVNDVVCEYTGYTRDELLITNIFNLLTEESQKLMLARLEKLMANELSIKPGEVQTVEYCIRTKGGEGLWVRLSARYIYESGKLRRSTGVVYNITDRKQAEEKLRESEANYRQLYNSSPAGIYRIDFKNGKFLKANDVFCEYLDCRQEEITSLNPHDILTEESNKLFSERVGKMALGIEVPMTVEYEISNKKGKRLCLQLNNKYIYDAEGYVVAADVVAHDVTERKQAEDVLRESEKKYRELSIIDDLTQLYNSKHFHAQLEIEIERSNSYFYGQPLTLLLLDLDKFKAFNDTYGHVEGDYVLSRLGQVIKRCLRETDSAYRYGGGEISIILPMTAIEEGVVKAKRLQAELRKETFSPVLDQNIYMTVSIGLAQYKPMEELKMFVHRVEKLMYQAKKDGRDRICSDASRSQRSFIGST
jgi:diguanylate cyclase (GGDEF)-like protein/PAS domain S-box-containing protein